MFKKISIFASIVGLLLVVALVIPQFIDVNSYRERIETEASNALGRKVTIGGNISLRLLPTPRVAIADVHIANDPAGAEKDFLAVEEASVSVELLPLISKKINISGVSIKNPQINLQKLSKDSNNWDFLTSLSDGQEEGSGTESSAASSGGSKLSIQNVSIVDGVINYRDGKEVTTVKDLNLDVGASSLDGPFKAAGGLKFNDKGLSFKVKTDRLQDGKPLAIEGGVEFDDCESSFEGQIDLASKTYKGKLEASIPATKAKEYGAPIAYDTSVTGNITANPERINFDNFVINYTDCYAKLSGEFVIASKFYQGPLELKLAGNKIRAVGAPIPSDAILQGKFMAGPASISYSDIGISMDGVKANGSVNLSLQGDRAYRFNFSGLPGGTSVSMAGAMANVNQGKLSLHSDNVRKFVTWLQLESVDVPELFMGQLKVDSNFAKTDTVTRLSGLSLAVGRSDVAGNVMFGKDAYEIDLKTSNIGNWLKMLGSDSKANGAVGVKGKFYGPKDNMQVTASTFVSGGRIDVSGNVKVQEKSTSFNVKLGMAQPDLSGLVRSLTGDPLPIHMRNFKLNSNVSGSTSKINFSDMKMSFSNGSSLTQIFGSGSYDKSGKKPMLVLDASMGDLNVNTMLAENKGPGNFTATLAKMRIGKAEKSKFTGWSADPINFAALNAMNAKLNIKTNSIHYGEYVVDKAYLPIEIKDGVMRIPNISGGIFGGKATGAVTVGQGSVAASVNFSGAQLRSLMSKDSKYNVNGGILNTNLNVHMQGHSQKALVSSMQGKLDLHVSEGELVGMDLQALSARLNGMNSPAALLSLMEGTTSEGKTPFNSIRGNFIIENGVARTDNLTMDSPAGLGRVVGVVNLPAYGMDMLVTMQLNGVKGMPPFKMRLRGPIDAPNKDLSTGEMSAFLFQKYGAGVLGKVLQKKGIPLPIPGIGGDESQGGGEQPAPQAPRSPRPEDVVGGLLKGLLKK